MSLPARVLLIALGWLLTVATPATAQIAANRAFEHGWRSGDAASQRQHELELQRRQLKHERFLQWEQDAPMTTRPMMWESL